MHRSCDADVFVALVRGARTRGEVWRQVDVAHVETVAKALRRLIDRGLARRVGRGQYEAML